MVCCHRKQYHRLTSNRASATIAEALYFSLVIHFSPLAPGFCQELKKKSVILQGKGLIYLLWQKHQLGCVH